MEIINFKKTEKELIITIPIDHLAFIAEGNPNSPQIIHNKDKFAELVLFELENNLGHDDGCTGFQSILDEACQEAGINADEDVSEFIEHE